MAKRSKYSDFVDSLDLEAIYDAIGFSPLFEDGKGNDVGYCLFPDNHSNGDTTGKFAIHRGGKVYNCWVCGGGSLLSLVMELQSVDSEEAEDWLRQFAEGDKRLDSEFVADFLDAFQAETEAKSTSLPYFNERVLAQWPRAFEWGEAQGIEDFVIAEYDVRMAPEMYKASPKAPKYANEPNYIGPALIVPHYWHGRLVGWQTRWLGDNRPRWLGKWTNTVDFPREETLYGWDQNNETEAMFVVESPKTVLQLASQGYRAMATFGSNVSDAQMKLLRRYRVFLAPDNDKAGQEWLERLNRYLKRFTEVYWIQPVPGEKSDLADVENVSSYLVENSFSPVTHPQEMRWAHT